MVWDGEVCRSPAIFGILIHSLTSSHTFTYFTFLREDQTYLIRKVTAIDELNILSTEM